MKEVKYRWIDKQLNKLTIAEKFHFLFWFPMLLLVIIALLLMSQNHDIRTQEAIITLQQKLDASAALVRQINDLSAIQLPQGIRLSNSGVVGQHTVNNALTITVDAGKQRYLSGSIDLSDTSMWDNQSSNLVLTTIGLLLMAIVSYCISTFITGAIYTLNRTLQQIADGDLTQRTRATASRDEFSRVGINVDKVAERQQHNVKLVHESAEALEMFAEEFRDMAIAGQSTAQSQRQYLESLATAMEEMTAAIREVARNANDTSAQTRLSSEEAAQGASSVNRTIEAIQSLADEISEASSAVEQLKNRAHKINEVVTVINSISSQTNLLALNAAIEAARAGEQGRGFAVVADEVRTLAGRTQQATVEIQKMIEELQGGTESLNLIMEKTVQRAASSRELITGVGHDIERIASYTESVFEMSAQIATSSEQQSSVAAEIAQNLEEVRGQAIQVEESTEATVAGTQNLKVTATELDHLLRGLKF
ncbi:MAG: methyl-accepting chemotaxis protein [Aeromonadaceae bacterium]